MSEGGEPSPPGFHQAPIVYLAYDPPGTFFSTVEEPAPKRVDDIYDAPATLSPSRRRLAQATSTGVQVRELAVDGHLLAGFEMPGAILGWDRDGTMLFVTYGTEGISRVSVSSGARKDLPFPAWVMRESNGPVGMSASRNGRRAAFVVWDEQKSVSATGFALLAMDTSTGAVLGQWALAGYVFPGGVVWADDGTIVFYSRVAPVVQTVTLGAAELSEPVTLPFQPCDAGTWVESHTLHMQERIPNGDGAYCGNSWTVATDGSSATKRPGDPPLAISPDRKKILLRAGVGQLVVADPDGGAQILLDGVPEAHQPVW